MSNYSRGKKLALAALFITAANFLGKLLGFLRDILISNYYGATAQTDAFFLALSIPTILIGIFTSSADSTILTQYMRISAGEEGRRGADRYFSNIINLLTIIATVAAVFTLLAPEWVIFLFAPTFQGEQLALACTYLQIFSFAGLLHIWYCFFCSYLLCYEKTTVRILLSFFTNVLVTLALFCIHDTGMYALSIAYLVGAIFSALFPMISSFRSGYIYFPVLSVKRYHFPDFIRFFLPIMGSALLADLLLYADRLLSSFLEAGSLSALNYGSKLINIFSEITVIGIGAILLPVLTRLQVDQQQEKFRHTVSAVCFCVITALAPLALLVVIYAGDLVSALYLRGEFTTENARMVSGTMQAYGIQILLSPLQVILVKTFHSANRTGWPFRVSLITFFLNICLSILLMQGMAVYGIALGTSVSMLVGCILLLGSFHREYGLSKTFFGLRQGVCLLVCLCLTGLAHRGIPSFPNPWIQLIVSGGGSFCVYLAAAFHCFRREWKQCMDAIR